MTAAPSPHTHRLTRLRSLSKDLQALTHEPRRLALDNQCPDSRLLAEIDDLINVIGDTAAAIKDADDFSLIVSNGKFIEGTGGATEDDHDIR